VHEDARTEPLAPPRGDVVGQRQLVPAATRDVVVGGRLHHETSERLEVGEGDDPGEPLGEDGIGDVRHPTRSRLARLTSIVLRPTEASLNTTVTSSSLRVSLEVTTIPSPQRPCRTRSPSRNARSPGMTGRDALATAGTAGAAGAWVSRSSSQARTGRPREPDRAPSSNASRLAARSRDGRNAS